MYYIRFVYGCDRFIEKDFIYYQKVRGPGWLSGCTLLSHKFKSAGSNHKKVKWVFFIPDSHLSEISDYGS